MKRTHTHTQQNYGHDMIGMIADPAESVKAASPLSRAPK